MDEKGSGGTAARLKAMAEAGSLPAQGVLGISYLLGSMGVNRNEREALRWLTTAAERGAPRPAVWLGTMYEKGIVVDKDIARAQELYRQGTERGEFLGCIFLARLLASGVSRCVYTLDAAYWYQQGLAMAESVEECAELEEARRFVAEHRVARSKRDD